MTTRYYPCPICLDPAGIAIHQIGSYEPDVYRCGCTTADRTTCTSTDAWAGRRPDGSCDCSCHGEYADDPENWQPLYIPDPDVDAEIRDAIEFEVAIEAAEALIEERP